MVFLRSKIWPLCVEWNEIAIRICRGGKTRVSPPHGPLRLLSIFEIRPPKFFWEETCVFADLADPKFWPITLPAESTSAWKKKGEKWQLCFNPQIIAKNGQKISKKFLVRVLGTLCINWNKFFEKKQKWQNLTIFGNFHQNLQALENKKVQNDNCVWTLRLLSEMAKKIQKKFWCMF